MPQLDKVTFLSQFVWLVIVFFSLYLILVKFHLPSIARILQTRQIVVEMENNSNSDGSQASFDDSTSKSSISIFNNVMVAQNIFDQRMNRRLGQASSALSTITPKYSNDFNSDASYSIRSQVFDQLVARSIVTMDPVSSSVQLPNRTILEDFKSDSNSGQVLQKSTFERILKSQFQK